MEGDELMSGGAFDYIDSQLKSQIFGWANKFNNALEDLELSELVWDILDLLHEYDWYTSGDTGEDTWLEGKKKFKDKWFGDRDERVKRTIDGAIEEARKELYKTYDIGATNGE